MLKKKVPLVSQRLKPTPGIFPGVVEQYVPMSMQSFPDLTQNSPPLVG